MDSLNYILDNLVPDSYFDPSSGLLVATPVELPLERKDLALLFSVLEFKKGVEIGVRGGEFSLLLCEAIKNLELYGIDPYTPHKGYKDITRQETFNKYEESAKRKLAPYKHYHFIKKLSMEALGEFVDQELDFVYIDGDHSFQSVTNDIVEWSKKVRPGGIISGDDYYYSDVPAHIQVPYVLDGYTKAHGIKPWFVLGSKEEDHGMSWFWVKQ